MQISEAKLRKQYYDMILNNTPFTITLSSKYIHTIISYVSEDQWRLMVDGTRQTAGGFIILQLCLLVSPRVSSFRLMSPCVASCRAHK